MLTTREDRNHMKVLTTGQDCNHMKVLTGVDGYHFKVLATGLASRNLELNTPRPYLRPNCVPEKVGVNEKGANQKYFHNKERLI